MAILRPFCHNSTIKCLKKRDAYGLIGLKWWLSTVFYHRLSEFPFCSDFTHIFEFNRELMRNPVTT